MHASVEGRIDGLIIDVSRRRWKAPRRVLYPAVAVWLVAFATVLALGHRGWSDAFRLATDGASTTGTVTAIHSHGECEFRYVVGGVSYFGDGPNCDAARVDETVTITFVRSAAHIATTGSPGYRFATVTAFMLGLPTLLAGLTLVAAARRPA